MESQPSNLKSPILASTENRIWLGAIIAACGAFAWTLLGFQEKARFFETIMFGAYCAFLMSWFVLPMGGFLGAIMPRIVRGCSASSAFLRGAIIGICVGVIAAILSMFFYDLSYFSGRATIVNQDAWNKMALAQLIHFFVTMTPLCAMWVGVWAFVWNRSLNKDS